MRVLFVDAAERPRDARDVSDLRAALAAAGHTSVLTTERVDPAGFDVVHALSVTAVAQCPGGVPLVVSPLVTVAHSGGQSVVRVEKGASATLSHRPGPADQGADSNVAAILTPSVESRVAWGATRRGRRVITVAPGVDTEQFTPVGSAAAPHDDRLRILFVGDLGPDSGAADMVRILRLMPSLEVVFTGGVGTDVAGLDASRSVHELACSLGVGGRVSFARPFQSEHLPHVLRSSDVVVDVSGSDAGHALVLQAMACGRPVIAADLGVFADLVVEDITGITVPPGNGMALKGALRRLVDDAFFLDSLGLAARDRAISRFSWTRIATETALAYERVLGDAAAAEQLTDDSLTDDSLTDDSLTDDVEPDDLSAVAEQKVG